MKHIYTDEAGTSAGEAISIVVALIVHCDSQWIPMKKMLIDLLQHVPKQYRENFYFHGKSVLAESKYPDWDMAERRRLMCNVMRIPRLLRVPVAIGAVRRNQPHNLFLVHKELGAEHFFKKLSRSEYDHPFAFLICMAKADEFVRNHCGRELAQIIADDLPTSNIKCAAVWTANENQLGKPCVWQAFEFNCRIFDLSDR